MNVEVFQQPAKDGGSYADRNTESRRIVIDGNFAGNSTRTIQTLAHEVGHAIYDYDPNYSTREKYIKCVLADEGVATLYNIRVQREIGDVDGSHIEVSGADSEEGLKFYNEIYDALESHKITRSYLKIDFFKKCL